MVSLAAITLFAPRHQAMTTLHGLFTDNMVLQRDKPIPIWGTAAPGQKVTVSLHGQTVTTEASSRGNWSVDLNPMPAGGPYTLSVQGDTLVQKQNVAIGEVWICSGQSNMEWPLKQTMDADKEVAAANYPDIRMYHVYHRVVDEPLRDMSGTWMTCRPEVAKNFTAVGYFFARALNQKLHIPIGLIESDWGGTPAESWTPRSALLAEPSLKGMVESYLQGLQRLAVSKNEYQRMMDEYNKALTAQDPGNKGYGMGYAATDFNDSAWAEITTPGDYKPQLHTSDNGGYWYRKTVDVPGEARTSEFTLELGAVDDYDVTYFNGTEVGHMGPETPNSWSTPRVYKIPAGLIRKGKNVISVRVWNAQGPGGLMGLAPMRLTGPDGFSAPLDGPWKFAVEVAIPEPKKLPPRPLAPGDPWVPSSLYNGMIAGLVPYGIRGAIWYQGESNADRAYQYRTLFPTMIKAWRSAFGQGDFPFYFVQLANYQERALVPREHNWAHLREAQQMTLSLPNTGTALAIDIGATDTIHPLNKQEVGRRLSLLALNRLYGQGGVDSGPVYKSMTVEGDTIRVRFTHADGGLYVHGDSLAGFQVAGEDRKFEWADAKIDHGAVVVSSSKVPHPVAVRYGWDINPVSTLYNGAGLPTSPFRSDDWPSEADGPRS